MTYVENLKPHLISDDLLIQDLSIDTQAIKDKEW